MLLFLFLFLISSYHLDLVLSEARHVVEVYHKNHQIGKSLDANSGNENTSESKQRIAYLPTGHRQTNHPKPGVRYATLEDLQAILNRRSQLQQAPSKQSIASAKYQRVFPSTKVYTVKGGPSKVSFLPCGSGNSASNSGSSSGSSKTPNTVYHHSSVNPKASGSSQHQQRHHPHHQSGGPVYHVPVETSYVNAATGQKLPSGVVPTIVAPARAPLFSFPTEALPDGHHHTAGGPRGPPRHSYHWAPSEGDPRDISRVLGPEPGLPHRLSPGLGYPGALYRVVEGPVGYGTVGAGPEYGPGPLGAPGFGPAQQEIIFDAGGPGCAPGEHATPGDPSEAIIPAEFFAGLFEPSRVVREIGPGPGLGHGPGPGPSQGFHHHHHEAGTFTSHYHQPGSIPKETLAYFALNPQYAPLPKGPLYHQPYVSAPPVHYSSSEPIQEALPGPLGPYSGYYLAQESATAPRASPNRYSHLLAKVQPPGPTSSGALGGPTFRSYVLGQTLGLTPRNIPEEELKGAYSQTVESLASEPDSEATKPEASLPIRVKKDIFGKVNEEGKPWGHKTTLTYEDPKDPGSFVQMHEFQMTLNRPLNPEQATQEIGKFIGQYQEAASSSEPKGIGESPELPETPETPELPDSGTVNLVEASQTEEQPLQVYDDKKKKK